MALGPPRGWRGVGRGHGVVGAGWRWPPGGGRGGQLRGCPRGGQTPPPATPPAPCAVGTAVAPPVGGPHTPPPGGHRPFLRPHRHGRGPPAQVCRPPAAFRWFWALPLPAWPLVSRGRGTAAPFGPAVLAGPWGFALPRDCTIFPAIALVGPVMGGNRRENCARRGYESGKKTPLDPSRGLGVLPTVKMPAIRALSPWASAHPPPVMACGVGRVMVCRVATRSKHQAGAVSRPLLL